MSYNPENPNGQATAANSKPVVIASDQSAVAQNLTEINGNAVATAASRSGGQRLFGQAAPGLSSA